MFAGRRREKRGVKGIRPIERIMRRTKCGTVCIQIPNNTNVLVEVIEVVI